MIKPFPKYKGYILFGSTQLFEFGVHIGHSFKKSIFYARWFLQGIGTFFFFKKTTIKKIINQWLINKLLKTEFIKRTGKRILILKKLFIPIFIINIVKTVLGIRSLIYFAQFSGLNEDIGWFVCHNQLFMPFTLRYALLLGMGYSIFDWIAGCLTNFITIFTLFFLIYREFMNGLLLEKKYYIYIYRLLGFNLTGFWLPSFMFLPRMLESRIANYEGGCFDAHSIAIIDSNALSGDTLLPLPSNDDSFVSVNFFFYILSFHFLKYRIYNFTKWRLNVRQISKRKFYWVLYYFVYFYRTNDYLVWSEKFKKFFLWMYQKPYFFFDDSQINTNLIPYGTFRFGLGCDSNSLFLMDTCLITLK